jgi:hypothetical protein
VPFDGLGVVLDSAPSSPLPPYSKLSAIKSDAEPNKGAISGILDDGTGRNWLDDDPARAASSRQRQAGYLENTIGECEAAFRNTQGLVWVRIAHFDGKIRVSWHTRLAVFFFFLSAVL